MLDGLSALGARLVSDRELRRAAASFFDACAARGIRAAPIKGLVVSAELYEDPLDRPFGDVDVLVAYKDVARVVALAKAKGWDVVYDSKQLGCVNVVLPPGIPFDVRGSIGPPGLTRSSAGDVLRRASACREVRICDAPLYKLEPYDQMLVLVVDALMDKLAVKTAVRSRDLERAVVAWIDEPPLFAARARQMGLATAAHLVLSWLAEQTGNEAASRASSALEPLPPFAAYVGRSLRTGPFVNEAHGWVSRIGIRMVADSPGRGLLSLALSAAGVTNFRLRNPNRAPWHGQLWRGPGDVESKRRAN